MQLFDSKTWAKMWATYALYDPSYQNPESFGFGIDVGNGWSTIIPCLLLNYGMIFSDKVSPLLLGCVTIGSYWQMLYGTLIYFFSFIFNRRYIDHDPLSISLFVGISNIIWIVCPALAIYVAVVVLRDGNMQLFDG